MLSARLQQLAQDFHAVADAADRLRAQPKLEATIELTGGSDRAQAEAIRRSQRHEELKEIIKAVLREVEKRFGSGPANAAAPKK